MLTRSPIRNTLEVGPSGPDIKVRREAPSIALNLSQQVFAVPGFAAGAKRCAWLNLFFVRRFCNRLLALAILLSSWN